MRTHALLFFAVVALMGCHTNDIRKSSMKSHLGSYVWGAMVLKLEPKGGYTISTKTESGRTTMEQGDWIWSELKQEFGLNPTAGDCHFEVRHLRVDDHYPRQLLWIPSLDPVWALEGAIEYQSFKREGRL